MTPDFLNTPVGPVATKMAISIGIGMLIGMERKWSHKEAGIRTFSIVVLLGALAAQVGIELIVVSMVGVFLLIAAMNLRSMRKDDALEVTTSAALLVSYVLGVLTGLGHIFTPVAGAIVMTMLLAMKEELNRFTGGLQLTEIRSAILLGLIGFVIYPLMPNRYVDHWNLFNPADAWISIIAIAGIGFLNYVLLRLYSSKGLYLGAVFGGLVNSTATIAEMTTRVQQAGRASRITVLSSIINIAMFTRNMMIAAIFVPLSLTATLLPLLAMSAVAALWIWRDLAHESREDKAAGTLDLASPISLKKLASFGLLFILIQVGGILLTRLFGGNGMLATGFLGGLVSSASTTAAAAMLAMHGQISPSVAGSTAILSSMASAMIDFPIIWRNIKDKRLVRTFSWKLASVLLTGVLAVGLDYTFGLSGQLIHAFK
ncbi:DUF4010 domain-containing protein [Mucilaginibacter sp. CAU 1740]|uniref:MgtC/SapB family protein n=1 Tax=Mucilaginibacter sp. CAU 1740 TaxID=3140365 RepID=UPI00325A7276